MQKRFLGLSASPAFRFVFTMGIVNLFADMTYEGGASLNGPFMGSLGASAAAISIVAGLGEFLGYGLRFISGYISDKTRKHWFITFAGYTINLFAVPAVALAGHWQMAAGLIILERIGRAIRKPTVESMLSYTTNELGKGWVYALNTTLDEIGATIGPLIVALVLFLKGSYRTAYASLLISTLLALAALTAARIIFPLPSNLEKGHTASTKGFTKTYWLYMVAGTFFAAGLMSYELISFHLASTHTVARVWVPVLLAFSTGLGVIASLVFGKWYDRKGLPILLAAVFLSSLFAPAVFLGGLPGLILAMAFWGIGYATQDTLLKAVVAGVLPEGRRDFAFGLFYSGYGVGWLIGSVVAGLLYQHSRIALIVFTVCAQLLSLPLFVFAERSAKK
jgi:predicted MFS family arabinose efflux permease